MIRNRRKKGATPTHLNTLHAPQHAKERRHDWPRVGLYVTLRIQLQATRIVIRCDAWLDDTCELRR